MRQVCKTCKVEKPLADFYVRKEMKNGHVRECKPCWTARNYANSRAKLDETRAYQRQWVEKNKDRIRSRVVVSRKKVDAKDSRVKHHRIVNHNRRAAQKAGGGRLSPDLGDKLLALQKGRCRCCRKKIQGILYHLDHIVPLSKGGPHKDSNMQLLCPYCNLSKGPKDPHVFAQKMGRLFL